MPSSNLGCQPTLFEMPADKFIVNVASVPQRSPFRYPGGKTWLIPRVRQWLTSLDWRPSVFIEPFAGGAIVGLTAAFENLADHVVLVEIDEQVAAVWRTILSKNNKWLIERILSFEISEKNVRAELAKKNVALRERAFQTILKNRTFHGGILAPGSSLMKAGENGKGLRSRWYANTLACRIRAIGDIRDRITFVQGDGMAVMSDYATQEQAAFFIDPPYTVAGKRAGSRLYTHHAIDHQNLFDMTSQLDGDFLMTYDNTPEISTLAASLGFQTQTIAMKNTHHARMLELLIGKNLNWVR